MAPTIPTLANGNFPSRNQILGRIIISRTSPGNYEFFKTIKERRAQTPNVKSRNGQQKRDVWLHFVLEVPNSYLVLLICDRVSTPGTVVALSLI